MRPNAHVSLLSQYATVVQHRQKGEFVRVNKIGGFERRTLNVFQRIARRFFGQWKSTRSSTVKGEVIRILNGVYTASDTLTKRELGQAADSILKAFKTSSVLRDTEFHDTLSLAHRTILEKKDLRFPYEG